MLEAIYAECNLYLESSESKAKKFFKTSEGQYAEKDRFISIRVPNLRKIAKKFHKAPIKVINSLITSEINEIRLLALFILIAQYQTKSISSNARTKLYKFYLDHLEYVNNWNLVDSSAHLIIGQYLFDKDRTYLKKLAESDNLWHRRISIVSTLYFIRQNDFASTFHIAKLLLEDKEDLIKKAVGWMLREVGERNQKLLIDFITQNKLHIQKTTLRYATEKISIDI